MNPEQQEAFARFMREHIPKPEGERWHPLYFISERASKVLGRPVVHWRDLSVEDARRVMKSVKQDA